MKISHSLNQEIISRYDASNLGAYEDTLANKLIESASKVSSLYSLSREKSYPEADSIGFAIKKILGKEKFEGAHIDCLDPALVLDNPCFKAYRELGEFKEGDFKFCWLKYRKGEIFVAKEKKIEGIYDREELGYFDEEVLFPAVLDKDVPWMSIIPHEIFTMARPIEEAKGKVATYGLGLGYYAFMVSEKEDVEEVYVIENDAEAIRLFKKHLLPCFPHKEKIHIVEGDALDENALEKLGTKIDFVFADLYHNADDALPIYAKLLRNEIPGVAYSYWIEDSILLYFRRALSSYLYEQAIEEFGDDAYQSEETYDDLVLKVLHKAMKGRRVEAKKELELLFSKEVCKEICRKLKFNLQ